MPHRLDSGASSPGSGMILHRNLIHPSIDRPSISKARGKSSFRSIEFRVVTRPLYVSVCHGSHRTVFSLASRILGAYEYRRRVTGQGRATEIPRVSTRSLAKRPRKAYPSGPASPTKTPFHQYLSRIVLRNKRRCTSIGPVGSCSVARSLVCVPSFGVRRCQGRTLGLVPLDYVWSER